MGLFRRKSKLPADRRPALDRDERVLAWAEVAAGARPAAAAGGADRDGGAAGDEMSDRGALVVATNLGLWLPGRAGRLGWHDLHKAVWSGRELTVTPAERVGERDGYHVVRDRPVESYLLLEPGDVPEQVRARVTRSVGYTSHHPLVGGGGVRVVARRVSGVDGLTWTVRYDEGTAADDPSVTEATDQLVAAARTATTPH